MATELILDRAALHAAMDSLDAAGSALLRDTGSTAASPGPGRGVRDGNGGGPGWAGSPAITRTLAETEFNLRALFDALARASRDASAQIGEILLGIDQEDRIAAAAAAADAATNLPAPQRHRGRSDPRPGPAPR